MKPCRRHVFFQNDASRVVIAMAVIAVSSVSTDAASQSATTNFAPDWDQRIKEALMQTGDLNSLAAELAAIPETSEVINAKVRVAIEQGDLSTALEGLKRLTELRPTDASVLQRVSYFEELTGANGPARASLEKAMGHTSDPAIATRMILRLAALAFDAGDAHGGVSYLDRASAMGTAAALQAGVVAYLYGQDEVAARYLHEGASDDTALRLLEGNAALKAGQTSAAKAAFVSAMDQASKPADRTYAEERLVATARQAGDLSHLVDNWLVQKDLPADRLLLLATILRELDRAPELIGWWRNASTQPSLADTLLSDRFVNEVLGAARSAGRLDDVVSICRALLARQPDDPRWLTATLRALLDQGHASEADTLLKDRISAAAKVPSALERLGKLAESLGRDDAAVQAAHQLVAIGGRSAMTGYLLEASVCRRANDPRHANDLLRRAAAIAEQDSDGLGTIVSALESADMVPAAIDLLQKSVVSHPSEDTLDRLASLLVKDHRPADAMAILRRLMQAGSSEGMRTQAGYRLLDVAEAAGNLDRLIAELKEKLKGGHATAEDSSFLVDAYVRKQDIDSAAAVLRSSSSLDRPTQLSRLAVLYLRAKKYDEADNVLRDLINADPENATETLERLADVALKRQRLDEAKQTIDRIAQRAGTGAAACEMMGGVNDRLGRPLEAAAAYRRALAMRPESADNWLLWSAAMTKAGRADSARHRLQVLCGEAGSDDVFAAAVDGLTNMASPAAVLRVVRRDAILRAAERPHQMMLYQVIADVSDPMQDADAALRATDASVSMSDEQRPEHLRELMDLASQSGDTSNAVNTGRSLQALGDDFPPDLFVQLGEQLLIGGHEAEASQAFARARESADADLIVKRIAAVYEKCGYPSAALDTLATISSTQQSDVDDRETSARLNETLGHYDAAFDNYLAAADIAVRGLAAERKRPNPAGLATTGPTATPSIIFGPSANVMRFGRLVGGALATARSTQQQDALRGMLRSHLDLLLEEPTPGSAVPADVAATAAALRRASFAFARPADAEAVDADVIARWPAAEAFKHDALNARLQEGLVEPARSFAKRFKLEADAAVFGLPPGNVTATQRSSLSPREAAMRLPKLLVNGRLDDARLVLSDTRLEMPSGPTPVTANAIFTTAPPFQVLVSAAAVLGDADAATRWALFWLDAQAVENPHPSSQPTSGPALPFLAPASSAVVQRYQGVIDGVWPVLTHDGRLRIVRRLVEVLKTFDDLQARAALSMCALRSAAMLGERLPETASLAKDALTVPDDLDQVMIATQVFIAVPAPDRPRVLRAAMASVPLNRQLDLLIRIVGVSSEPLDAETDAAMIKWADQLQPGQAILWGNWFLNTSDRPLLNVLAEAVLRRAANPAAPDAEALTAAAAAFANIGNPTRGDQAANLAIAALRLPSPASSASTTSPAVRHVIRPRPGSVGLLRLAIASMSSAARAAALEHATTNVLAAPVANVLNQPLVQALLLDSVGRRTDALSALRFAFQDDPSDPMIARAYADRLQDDGRWAELIEHFARRDLGSDFESRQLRTIVDRGLMELLRGREMRADTAKGAAPDLARRAVAGDARGLAESFRILLRGERNSQGFFTFTPLPSSGGLAPASDAREATLSILNGFSEWPGALDDALRAVRIPPDYLGIFGRDRTPSWPAMLIAKDATREAVCDQALAALQSAASAHVLTRSERQLVTALAASPTPHVPASLLDELLPAALADGSGAEMLRLGHALVAQKIAGGSDVLAWANAAPNARNTVQGPAAVLSPMRRQDDASLAEGLADLSEKDPELVENELQRQRAMGRIGPDFWTTNCLWARLAAERGDFSAFQQRVDELLRTASEVRLNPIPTLNPGEVRAGPDLRLTLPIRQANEASVRASLDALQQSLAVVADKEPSNTDISRQLAALANWAIEHGEKDSSEAFYRRAKVLADRQGTGEHQLWVADVAAKLGHGDVSISIERGLIEDRCLPALRIVKVLQRAREQDNAGEILKLTAEVASYCPAVITGRPRHSQ